MILENIKSPDKKTHFGFSFPKCVFAFILS